MIAVADPVVVGISELSAERALRRSLQELERRGPFESLHGHWSSHPAELHSRISISVGAAEVARLEPSFDS